MAADGLSKPLPPAQFKKFMGQIGMILKGKDIKEPRKS
jgi:hypothetical protein